MSLPAYPEYKDSGVEWLGPVPAHWQVTPLKYLVGLASGSTPSKDAPEYWNGEIPWVSAKDMKVEYLVDAVDHVTEHAVERGQVRVLPVGSVVVVVRGMILARAFPVAVTLCPLAINQDLKALLCSSECLSDFLAWYLRGTADESMRRLDEAGHGTKALRMDAWTSISVALPTLEEQSAIASFLDRETGKIDALVEEQEKLIELLKEKRQAIISHAATKGLDPDAPMKDSGVEWLGEVPAHWSVVRLKNIVSRIEQGWSPEAIDRLAEPGELGVLKAGCVNYGVFRDLEHKTLPDGVVPSDSLIVRIGDVLMSRASGSLDLIGAVALVEACNYDLILSDKIFRIAVDEEVCVSPYLVMSMASSSVRAQIRLSVSGADGLANNIGMASIRRIWLALPPLPEQEQIVAEVQQGCARLDLLTQEAEQAIRLLKERRSALISAAVTGKIDVRGLAVARATEAA